MDYAVANNISIAEHKVQVDRGELEVTSAKDAFLPTVSANASEGFNFGRGLTSENIYANRNTSNFQWGVGLSLPLFEGLQNVRTLKAARSSLDQLLLEHKSACEDLTMNVITQYLQVLYNKEVVRSAESQLAYSTFEVERQRSLIEAGKVAEAVIYDAEAQQARDRLTLVEAENDTRIALVNLANLLQLQSVDDFDIAPFDSRQLPAIEGPDVIYSRAMQINSGILAARRGLDVAEDNIAVARSGYIPRLSFDASVGSTYYTVAGIENPTFGAQMRNNFSTYLGLRLSVPIFDAFATRNAVKRARLQQTSAQLELDRRQTDLYKNIQLAYTQAAGARDRFRTSEVTLEKTRLSFDAVREKYSLGRATSDEFEQAKNNLFRVEVALIQARYEYLLRHRLLQYYATAKLN